jgi:argininosuccinate synthase
MSAKFGSYGEMNNAWSGEDVRGFSKILSNQTMIYSKISKENE